MCRGRKRGFLKLKSVSDFCVSVSADSFQPFLRKIENFRSENSSDQWSEKGTHVAEKTEKLQMYALVFGTIA